ncbi:MAG: hypothetical protein IJV98_07580 [Clostridia bacterium]|nr:hypothetical protein [Clostridia bacterium]
MFKRFRNWNKKLAAGILAACFAVSALPMTAVAASAAPRASTNAALNFSHAGATSEKTMDVSDLIYRATGESISSAEAAYLRAEGITMLYDDSLPTGLVSVSSIGGDAMKVTATAKAYRAYNGTQIRWIPTSVTLGDVTKSFNVTQSGYVAEFSGLEKEQVYTATVFFEAQIPVSASTISLFVNYAYDAATAAIAEMDRYEQAQVAYEQALLAYQDACKSYETLYAEYQKYLAVKKQYDADLQAHKAYLDKVAAYDAAVKKYEAYLSAMEDYNTSYEQYEKDLAELPAKQEAYEKYLAYLAQVQEATKQLAVIESAFIADSLGRTLFATLKGDTVAQVIAQKDTLVNLAGASAADIDNAGDATLVLQTLLTAYRKISSTEEKIRWYAANYESLKANFIKLYSSLFNLGSNVAVQRKLRQEGKFERYAQFVSQLYIITMGLDDTMTFDTSWEYYGFSVNTLIEPCQHIVDNNSYAPSSVSLPEPMSPVSKPAVPTAPKKPTEVTMPVKTWTEDVEHPGDAPAVVAQPKKPALSDFVSGAPTMPQISSQLQSVVSLVRSGALQRRTGTVRDTTISLSSSYSQSASLSSYKIVTFYDYDKKTVLSSTQVEKGATAVYGSTIPTRPADDMYTYTFAGWTDASGNPAKLTGIESDTAVYASYTKQLREYTVTWVVGTAVIRETYAYGTKPTYRGETSYRDGEYQYVFSGWSPSVTKVTEDVVYTAQYTKHKLDSLTFAITFSVQGERYYRTYAYGDTPSFDEFEKDYVSGGYRYVFTGWSPVISPVTDDKTYVANFEKAFLVPAGEDGKQSAELVVTKTTHTVVTEESVVDASYAVKQALASGTKLVLELGGASVTIENETLAMMPTAAHFRLTAKTDDADYADTETGISDGKLSWILEITDKDGNAVRPAAALLLSFPIPEGRDNDGRWNAYVNGTATLVNVHMNMAYLRTEETGEIVLAPFYTVDIISEGSGDAVATRDTAEAGSAVRIDFHAEQGWHADAVTVSVNGGAETALTLTDGTFIMPAGDVVIRVTFAESEYTVVFVANGEEISRETYRYGDTVREPDMSSRLVIKKGKDTYTFSGWDRTLSSVTGDVTYTAKYDKGTVGSADDTYISEHDSNRLMTVVLPIVITVIVLAAGGITAWIVIRKKKAAQTPESGDTDSGSDGETA